MKWYKSVYISKCKVVSSKHFPGCLWGKHVLKAQNIFWTILQAICYGAKGPEKETACALRYVFPQDGAVTSTKNKTHISFRMWSAERVSQSVCVLVSPSKKHSGPTYPYRGWLGPEEPRLFLVNAFYHPHSYLSYCGGFMFTIIRGLCTLLSNCCPHRPGIREAGWDPVLRSGWSVRSWKCKQWKDNPHMYPHFPPCTAQEPLIEPSLAIPAHTNHTFLGCSVALKLLPSLGLSRVALEYFNISI